jgi:hypothetical protein
MTFVNQKPSPHHGPQRDVSADLCAPGRVGSQGGNDRGPAAMVRLPLGSFFLKIESLPLSMDIFIFSLAGTLFSWISKMNPKKTRPIEAGIF